MLFETQYKSGPSYILQSGVFLNLNSNKKEINKPKKVYHLHLDNYIKDNRLNELYKEINFAIRINDGSNTSWEGAYINLNCNKPNKAQEEALLDFMYELMQRHFKSVFVSNESKDVFTKNAKEYKFANIENEQGYLPEEIIKEIKTIYS